MNPWLILGFVLAVGAAAGGGYFKGHAAGEAVVKLAWDTEKRQLAEEHAENLRKSMETQLELQANADRLRREKDAEIKNINARASALANSLRDRPERPAQNGTVSDTARSCAGASGAELARRDGEFLVGYSADAAQLAKALDYCEAQYNAVKKKFNKE